MKTAEIKRRFLDHFAGQGHTVVPSASLLSDDPDLLFVPAGMVPFKPYFTGRLTPPWQRAVSVQKCVRTLDIEEVGRTTRHGSFFQMTGNFSFGDYFKERAIPLAWELATKSQADGGYGFDPDQLWATVYTDDDEAADIWHRSAGVPKDRIVRLGMGPNFWSMGVPGPCGPCSELLIDRGPRYGPEYDPASGEEPDGERYLEFWNLVFMQYERGPGTGKTDFEILGDLPARSIDTGMGLERVAALLQGVDNLYEIDEVKPILERAAELAGKTYPIGPGSGDPHPDDVRLRVVADHVRAALMLIGDGAVPGNEGRGYVVRRILRRTVRAMRLLGYEPAAFPDLFPVARDCMSPSYPEVADDFARIAEYAYAEEEAFRGTLRQGTTIFDGAVTSTRSAGRETLSGSQAFQLHDTYGFPIELTLEMAAEQGLSVDEDGFRRLMAEQRERAKQDTRARRTGAADVSAYRQVLDEAGPTRFTGYVETARESNVVGLVGAGGVLKGAARGEEVEVVLDATPFYAEGGGQQSDTGELVTGSGRLQVLDVQTPVPGLVTHRVKVLSGEVRPGEPVYARIDEDRRRSVSKSHSATHLVHAGIRRALGDTAAQAGSMNAPGRLRFDFSSPTAVSPGLLVDIEDEVNAVLADDMEVRAFVTSQEEAKRIGAIAMFGEKYGDEVRVVEIGDYSRELCGGTHVPRSTHIGMVKLLAEASIGSGVRRVEALVGLDAFRYLAREHVLVARLAEQFKAKPDELPDRVAGVVAQLKDAERELSKLRAAAVLSGAAELAANPADVAGVGVAGVAAPDGTAVPDARSLAQAIAGRLDGGRPGVAAVTVTANGRASLIVAVNPAGRELGLSAADLVRGALAGKGGGSPAVAQGGGLPADAAPGLLDAVTAGVVRAASGTA